MIDCLHDDFQWEVSYTYDTSYSCEESGCNQEGICRCGEIQYEVITSIDVSKMSKKIYDSIFDNSISTKRNNIINSVLGDINVDIERYTIDRILRSHKIWNPAKWTIKIGNGYYGQEVDSITMRQDVIQNLETDLEKAFEITDLTKRIEFLLELENGFILDDLKRSTYSIETIDINDVIFGNKEHHKKVKSKDLDFYSDRNYNGIRGIVQKKGDKWKIIDGYHRLSKTENKMVKVIVCS